MKGLNYLLIILFFCLNISCKKDNDNKQSNLCDTLVMTITNGIEYNDSKMLGNDCKDLIIEVHAQVYKIIDSIKYYYFPIPYNIDNSQYDRITIIIYNYPKDIEFNWSTGEKTSSITIEESGIYWYNFCYNTPTICRRDTFVLN